MECGTPRCQTAGALAVHNGSDAKNDPPRILNKFLDAGKEGDRLSSVDDPVGIGKRQIHHRANHDGVIDHDRAFLDLVHARMPLCGGFRIGVDISEP